MRNNYSDFKLFSRSRVGLTSTMIDDYARITDSYINPTILEERKLNVAQMDVFSRLLYDNIIFLGEEIDDDVANIVQAQLLYLSSVKPDTDISIYVNSPGGVVSSGLAIYDTMQIIQPDVATICTGEAASMAAVLLAAGTHGKRSILPHSKVMIHQPLGGCKGQASDILITAEEIKSCRDELFKILAEHTGQKISKISKDGDRDYWMTAQQAVDYGMVDKIVSKKKNESAE